MTTSRTPTGAISPQKALKSIDTGTWDYYYSLEEGANITHVIPVKGLKKELEIWYREEKVEETNIERPLSSDPKTEYSWDPEALPPFESATRKTYVDHSIADCSTCEGEGTYCHTCDGNKLVGCPRNFCYNGKLKEYCGKCEGTGEIRVGGSKRKVECDNCIYGKVTIGACGVCSETRPLGKVECDDCEDGIGTYPEDKCEDCEGEGEVQRVHLNEEKYSVETTANCAIEGDELSGDDINWTPLESANMDNALNEDLMEFDVDGEMLEVRSESFVPAAYRLKYEVESNEYSALVSDEVVKQAEKPTCLFVMGKRDLPAPVAGIGVVGLLLITEIVTSRLLLSVLFILVTVFVWLEYVDSYEFGSIPESLH